MQATIAVTSFGTFCLNLTSLSTTGRSFGNPQCRERFANRVELLHGFLEMNRFPAGNQSRMILCHQVNTLPDNGGFQELSA